MSPTFAQLGVPNSIVSALASRNILEPFQIQSATIKDALAGRDVCGRAPTGSGKTLAFGIPLVASIDRAEPKRPRGLILAPTRELAEQINTELRTFAGSVRIGVVYGGVGYQPQVNALRRGVEILVACPGRLEDLIEQGFLSLCDVDRVVLDEADRMADMGFMPAVRRLLDQTSSDRQTLLFSATLDGDVAKLTRDYQRDPVKHEVGDESPDITAARHMFWYADRTNRVDITAQAIEAAWPSIVFCRTRHGSDRVVKQLSRAGVDAVAIHGGRSQAQRTRALADFSSGRVQALIATDVASRGIHVDGVASVVHYDPPEDHKAYVHRSGRTARAGETGIVISLVQPEQKKDARRLQRDVGLDEPFTAPDTDAVRELTPSVRVRTPAPKPEPAREQRPGQRHDARRQSDSRRGDQRRNGQRRSEESGGRNGQRRNEESGGGAPRKGGQKKRSGQQSSRPQSGGPKPKNRADAPGRAKSGSKSGRPGPSSAKQASGGAKSNRKARRAHLQPGASGAPRR